MFMCQTVSTPARSVDSKVVLGAAVAARAAARTADRSGATGCCDVCCADDPTSRRRQVARVRQQDRLPRPLALEAQQEEAAEAEGSAAPSPPTVGEEEVEICFFLHKALGLPQADFMGTADPYVEIRLMPCDPLAQGVLSKKEVKSASGKIFDRTLWKTTSRIVRGSLTPQWDEAYYFSLKPRADLSELFIYIRVLDYDVVVSDDFLGHCSFRLLDALSPQNDVSAGWRALLQSSRSALERLAVLRDPHLTEASGKPQPFKLVAPLGQEKTYDLSAAQIFLQLSIMARSSRPLFQKASSGSPPQGGPGEDTEASQRLAEAVANGDLWEASALLETGRASVNCRAIEGDFQGHTALHIACLTKHLVANWGSIYLSICA
eukprot:s64_g9.t2